jgi:dihydroorotase
MLSDLDGFELPASFDAHVHLRDATMMEAVVPTIRKGGVNMVYVMVLAHRGFSRA